jgi:hypothetical protein
LEITDVFAKGPFENLITDFSKKLSILNETSFKHLFPLKQPPKTLYHFLTNFDRSAFLCKFLEVNALSRKGKIYINQIIKTNGTIKNKYKIRPF